MADPNLTGTSANYDWGVYNAISNGGNVPNQWRTLTNDEWNYLRNIRTDASSKYATGRIQLANGSYVNGCIFLPDRWRLPTGCSFTAGASSSSTDYSRNTYTLSQWSLMESAGALFMPTAGSRFGTSYVYNFGDSYWSSSSNNCGFASGLLLTGNMVQMASGNRSHGRSVRLVHDIN